jgi:peptidoglycan/LPS O-acetylase OafA/YrhL
MKTARIPEQSGRERSKWIRISFESIASRSAKYRPDVDGLRAVAVLAVLFFHTGLAPFRGGYVGVDIFYVISGYLITSILVKDLTDGKFSLVTFYERRMRRIFPALFTVLFFCMVAASVLFDPREMISFGKSLLTTTFFVSNFYFWHSAQPLGYFDRAVSSQPLLHTWSLSVEEQFYLFFPVTLFLLFRWTKRVNAWLIVLTAASFALNIWATQHKPVVAFYWIMPRAWELLAGAMLATKAVPHLRNRILREFAGFLGLGMIIAAVSFPIRSALFPGYIVLLPCLGTWLVIYAGEAGGSLVRTLLSFRPLVFVGVISYSLYLWHWPVIVFSNHLPFQITGNSEIAFVLLSSIALAFISFEYIERPFRGGSSPFSRRQIFAFGFAASTATFIFGSAAFLSRGLWQRYDAKTRQVIEGNLERMDDFDGSCSNWKTELQSVNHLKFCSLGSQPSHRIMFWGDSHVEQMYPAIKRLYGDGGSGNRGAILAIASACLPDENLNTVGDGYHCDAFSKYARIRAEEEDIDTVFLGFSTWLLIRDKRVCEVVDGTGKCGKLLLRNELIRRFEEDLSGAIRALKKHGKNVVVCLPFPIYDKPIPELEISNAVFGRFGLSDTATDITSPTLGDEIRAVALGAGAEIFDPRLILCPGRDCLTQVNGISIYKDTNHLAGSQVGILESSLREVLQHEPFERTVPRSPPWSDGATHNGPLRDTKSR